jgi:hypothetical protein
VRGEGADKETKRASRQPETKQENFRSGKLLEKKRKCFIKRTLLMAMD